jgi:hypothetical protein
MNACRIRIRIHTSDKWIRIQEAKKHVDQVDPDGIRIRNTSLKWSDTVRSLLRIKSLKVQVLLHYYYVHLICRPSFRVGLVPSAGEPDSDPLARGTDPDQDPSFFSYRTYSK